MGNILEFAGIGEPPARWFSSVDPTAPGLAARYRWSARLLRWGSLLAGVSLPAPEYVPADDLLRIARWTAAVLADGGTPHISIYVSAGVRLCQVAQEAGLELRGAKFTAGGEPLTEARLAVFRAAGVEAVPGYSTIEAGRIGYGCVAAAAPDDYHLLHDLVALIQPGLAGEQRGLPPRALLVRPAERLAGRPGRAGRARLRLPAGAGRLDHPPAHRPQLREADSGRYDLPGPRCDSGAGGSAAGPLRRRADRLPAGRAGG
jgi:hypothetical protein